jgi:hypothetical protein
MRLFEFAENDPLRVKLTTVASQLESDYQNSNEPLSLDDFLTILRTEGVSIDKSDIYDIIKKEPLVNIIDSIEQGNVIFKGQVNDQGEPEPSENEKTLQQMASRQVSK